MVKVPSRSSYFSLFSIFIIFFLGIIVYSNTLDCSFHFDDQLYIIDNYFIRNIHELFSNWTFYPCRIVTFLTIGVNYHFNGLNVFSYHLFNIAVHLAAAVLVWWLTLLTLSTPVMKTNKIFKHADLIALFAGLVFVSHPLQTEAVTYIWQRTTSLVAFFYLASLCLYVKSRSLLINRSNLVLGRTLYILSLITAIVAMFTKENAVTLPLAVLLYEYHFFENKKGMDWKHLGPFLVTIFIIPLTILLAKAPQFQTIQRFVGSPSGTSPLDYLLTQFNVIVTYIMLLFLPLNQNLDYDYPVSKSLFEFPTLTSFILLAGAIFGAKQLFSKYRLLSFSIFWFFLTLSLESSVFPLANNIFEHRLYLPMVGFCIFLVSGVYYLFGKDNIKTMIIVLMIVIGFNSILTFQRNSVWKDEFTLWSDTVQRSPNKARPNHILGLAYAKKGDYIAAMADFNKAIAIDPNFAKAYYDRGNIYSRQGKLILAMADLNKAIAIDPDLALAYSSLGNLYDKQGDFNQALLIYNKAIVLNSNLEDTYYNRGNTYAKHGDLGPAMADYTKVIAIDDNNAEAYNNRGNVYSQLGSLTLALSDYNKTIELDPNYIEAYINRGNTYSRLGNFTQALSDYNIVIAKDPKYADAYVNRAIVYYQLKKYDMAWNDVHKAQSLGGTLNPNFIHVLKNNS